MIHSAEIVTAEIPRDIPQSNNIVSYEQLIEKIRHCRDAKENIALNDTITTTIKYLSKKGKCLDLFRFLTRSVELDEVNTLIGIKLLVEEQSKVNFEGAILFDHLCALSSAVSLAEAKLIWLQIALFYSKWLSSREEKLRLLNSATALFSASVVFDKAVCSTSHLYLDLVYSCSRDLAFDNCAQMNAMVALPLCGLYKSHFVDVALSAKIVQVAKQIIQPAAVGVVHFCGLVQSQSDVHLVQGAIRLTIDVFGEHFTAETLNYYLSALRATAHKFNRCPTLLRSILYGASQLVTLHSTLSLGDIFTWKVFTEVIECVIDLPDDESSISNLVHSTIKLFEEHDSTCLQRVIALVSNSKIVLSVDVRLKCFQLKLQHHSLHSQEEDLPRVLQDYLELETDTAMANLDRVTSAVATLKTLHSIPQSLLQVTIHFVDKIPFDDELEHFCRRIQMLLFLVTRIDELDESKIAQFYDVVKRNIVSGLGRLSKFGGEAKSFRIRDHIIRSITSEQGVHMTKCFETMDVFLRALYSNVDKSSASDTSDNVVGWKFWRHERAELLHLIFSIRQFDKQIWLVTEAGVKVLCPLSPKSHILREIYQTAIFVLQTEINFFLKKDLFHFGCSAFVLSVIGGSSVDDVDNLSSAIENHELFFTFGPQIMFDIVEIFDALSVSEKANPDEPKYPFELYKKDFLAEHVELAQADEVKFEELQLVTISCLATIFSYFGMMDEFFVKRGVEGSPPKMPPFSVFIHRLSFSCRSIVSGQTRSNEQKSQVALNSLSLAALTAAVADLPLKVFTVRLPRTRFWLMEDVIHHLTDTVGRNWPVENIPWFLEFLSQLIRRPDLALLLNEEKYYLQVFTILSHFTNGDLKVEDEEARYDHHYTILLAHLNVLKLFFRIAPEKRQRYLNHLIGNGKQGLLYRQGISDIEDKIKDKRHKLRRNSFGAKSAQIRDEKRLEEEKKIKEEIKVLQNQLLIHQNLLTTTRDIFKHNLNFQVPVYVPPREDLLPFFSTAESKSWTRGFNIHTIKCRLKGVAECEAFDPYLPDYEEIIRKPAGMVRFYGNIHNISNPFSSTSHSSQQNLTPEKVYLYKYDTSDPCGRTTSESMPIVADGIMDQLRHLDRLLPYYRPQIAVVFVGPGQQDWADIFRNDSGSARFRHFATSLGDKVCIRKREDDLEHNILVSGLEFEKHGLFTMIKNDDAMKIQYQISPFMPSNVDNAKASAIGNREIMVVWDESHGSYIPGQQFSDFPFLEIVIRPGSNRLCSIQTMVTNQFIARQRGEMKLPNKLKSFQKLKTGNTTRQLKSCELGGPTYITDRNVPGYILTQVIHHSLTLKFCEMSKRRTPLTDPFLETVTACDRMNQITRIRDEALRSFRQSKATPDDQEFNLDFVFQNCPSKTNN